MYREAKQTQATESAEANASEGSEKLNDDQGSKDYSQAQYDSDLGDEVPFEEGSSFPQFLGLLI